MCKVVYSNSLLAIKSVKLAFLLRDFHRDKIDMNWDKSYVLNFEGKMERIERKPSLFSKVYGEVTFWSKIFR